MRGVLYLVAGLALGAGVAVTVAALASGCRVQRDPLTDEVAAVLGAYEREWADVRDTFPTPKAREAAYRGWQSRRAADVRTVYARHGRTPPAAWKVGAPRIRRRTPRRGCVRPPCR